MNNSTDTLATPRKHNASVALYSFPGESGFRFLIQDDSISDPDEFWFYPFYSSSDQHKICLRGNELVVSAEELSVYAGEFDLWHFLFPENTPPTGFEDFKSAIEKVQDAIRKGELQKAVLSRVTPFGLPADFHPFRFLCQIRSQYPNAFISMTSTPFSGTWIGASPEVLLMKRGLTVSTISLAGTRTDNSEPWSAKEYHEQQLVTDTVQRAFSSDRFSGFKMDGPREYRIGHLLHLRTTFQAELKQDLNRDELLAMVENLHPTPAVGGSPKADAIRFILDVERHRRFYYSGFLGTHTRDNDLSVFVNLRCMTVAGRSAYILTGAGITEGSDVLREWKETAEKAGILLKILHSANNPEFDADC